MSREEAQAVGVRSRLILCKNSGDAADGYYFMVPFNRAGMIAEIMKKMKYSDQ